MSSKNLCPDGNRGFCIIIRNMRIFVVAKASAKKESVEKFDHPQYTRPETFVVGKKKLKVPKVLLSGDHKKIQEWRERHKTKVLKLTRLLT